MKKKILIISHALELGGAERSLIGLLDALNADKYEIDIFLLRHEGELLEYIPKYVRLLPEIPAYTVLARPMKDTLREGHFLLTAARLWGKFKAHNYDKKHQCKESGVALEYSHKYTWRLMPRIVSDIEYDLAISFLTPHYIAANKVRAKKKIAWIHTDYAQVEVDVASECKMWSAYDHIVSISESVSASFVSVFPALESKLVLIENILPEKLVKKQAKEFEATSEMPRDGSIRFLSIGRYCYAKNFDNLPEICYKLLQQGLNITWYIIGFGPDEDLIRAKIAEYHLDKRVVMLGKKANPYPYIEECDVYLQLSRYEGKSVTVREAQMFGKPVVITNYATSDGQLEDGVDGIIVPLDSALSAKGIETLLEHPETMSILVENCKKRDYSNAKEIMKLYKIISQ